MKWQHCPRSPSLHSKAGTRAQISSELPLRLDVFIISFNYQLKTSDFVFSNKCSSAHLLTCSLRAGSTYWLFLYIFLSIYLNETLRQREDRQPTLRNVLCGFLTTGMVNSLGSTFLVALWVFFYSSRGRVQEKPCYDSYGPRHLLPAALLLCILSRKGLYKMGLL